LVVQEEEPEANTENGGKGVEGGKELGSMHQVVGILPRY
jgi:hypothetical protein